MNYIKILSFFILTAAVSFTGCESFDELNENPNEPTVVSPDVLLTSAIRSSMNSMVTESFLLSNNIAQLTAKTLRTEVDEYNWNAFPTVWESLYESLTDVYTVERLAVESVPENPQLEGVAIVLRSWLFANLTNAYGNIPYSEAIKGGEPEPNDDFTPVYDDQEAIYTDLLAELARANDLLAEGGSVAGDILLNGEVSKWQKLCNSLRLRLLMTAGNKISDAGDRFARIVNNDPIMTSNEDNATLTYLSGLPNQFPLIPLKTGDFDAVAFSQTALDVFNEFDDPRLMRYARPDNDVYADSATFSGAVNGAGGTECNKSGSRLGVQYFNYPELVQASQLNLPIAEGILMTYSEVEFLLAEAIAKTWITGSMEDHYRNGIQASMDYYQVDYEPFGWTDFNDFYDNSGVAYSEVKDIWKQKWLALYFHGLEPYFEVRRWYYESNFDWAGIPFLEPACQNVNNDMLPLRFLYPGEEQSLNAANYQDAVSRLGGVNSQNAKMWLME